MAFTNSEFLIFLTSSGEVVSVKYNTIRGSKALPSGTCAMMRSRYAFASSTVLTGGTVFGIQIARENCWAKSGTVRCNARPSRR